MCGVQCAGVLEGVGSVQGLLGCAGVGSAGCGSVQGCGVCRDVGSV